MSLAPGQTFGRYAIRALLGKGGMGEVYLAEDTLLHRRVALKVLRASSEPAEDGVKRILREARAAARIDHPGAVAIYDVGEIDGVPFLVMELVTGSPLRAFVKTGGVPLARRVRWIAEIARALAAAHKLGLVHRDVKPENVMVRDDDTVKVLDFGLARRAAKSVDPRAPTNSESIAETFTTEGGIAGTPIYMAPEQMRGEALDGRADQFAWGVLAYELLTGRLPWNIDARVALVVEQVLSREVDPLRTHDRSIPEAVDLVVRRALEKAPRRRFVTLDEAADALEPFALPGDDAPLPTTKSSPALDPGPPRPAPPPEAPLPAPRRLGARRGWRVVIAGVCGALVASAIGFRAATHRSKVADAVVRDAASPATPLSQNHEATLAYLAGMRAIADASPETAHTQLDRAIELDHWFAAAHVGRALLESVSNTPDVTNVEEDLRDARTSRAALSPRDAAILDALEPWALVPPDMAACERRFRDAAEKFPGDPLVAIGLGFARTRIDDADGATKAFERALAIDPSFAIALRMMARERLAAEDVAGAIEDDRKCMAVSPGATWCLADLAALEEIGGKCDELVGTSRTWVAVAPQSTHALQSLAGALAGIGATPDAIHAVLEQRWQRFAPAERPSHELEDEAILAMLTGDFVGAAADFEKEETELASSPREMTHFHATYGRVLTNAELGRDADVMRIATAYFRQRAAWEPNSFGIDPAMYLYAQELAAGGITRADLDRLRAKWSPGSSVDAWYAWAVAWAGPALTAADAARAFAMMPPTHPLWTGLDLTPDVAESLGRVAFLGGRMDEAIRYLKRASDSCALFDRSQILFATRAAFELGEALDAKGDAAGACAAYGRVLTRWGAAKPPSKTATEARAQAKKLGCPP